MGAGASFRTIKYRPARAGLLPACKEIRARVQPATNDAESGSAMRRAVHMQLPITADY